MDIASIIGVISGTALVCWGILLGSSLLLFWDLPSVVIVMGCSVAAALIQFPLGDFLKVGTALGRVFKFKTDKPEDLIQQLVTIANKARQGGLLSIEADIKETKDPYLASALQMTVDGVKTADIASIMQKKMEMVKKEHKTGVSVLAGMAAFGPAFGMVGTLIGLVQMLANLDDPSTIGPSMAVAMITTFYGALLANLFFIPMSEKLKSRSDEVQSNMNLLYEGIICIRDGVHPRLMEDKLKVYLSSPSKPAKEGK
ncbi:MAG: MotA/TolQ/ExbB proton channel family protein [Desulfobacterales bacterium]|nr:MotA/TolQ/ExbB proton channel family protein [Desulfobacterales bacterium]